VTTWTGGQYKMTIKFGEVVAVQFASLDHDDRERVLHLWQSMPSADRQPLAQYDVITSKWGTVACLRLRGVESWPLDREPCKSCAGSGYDEVAHSCSCERCAAETDIKKCGVCHGGGFQA